MENITSIGFDFDDTLVFSETTKERIFADIFAKEYGIEEGVIPAYRSLRGKANREEKIDRLIRELLEREPAHSEVEKISTAFGEQYKTRLATCPVADCVDVIKELKKYVNLLFLLSLENTNEVLSVAEHCGIAPYFDVILGGPKSKRENFEKLIREYPVRPSETLYIGDSKQDVIISTSYGFKTVGIQGDLTSRNLMKALGAYGTYCNLSLFQPTPCLPMVNGL